MAAFWTFSDKIILNDVTADVTVAGRYVFAEPVPPLPDGHYLMADGAGVVRPTTPILSAQIAQDGTVSIPGLPCAASGTQDPIATPWRITLPGPDGRTQQYQGEPPTSADTLKITDLLNGVDGASNWKVV